MKVNNEFSIALLLPYFGSLPNYFQLWLDSAKYNEKFDFFIITDSVMDDFSIPKNVHIIRMTFLEVKKRVAKVLPYSFKLAEPYKLCDYRPLFGLVFQDVIMKYKFWGHCDPDIIWGDLSKYITPHVLASYDRIYTSGHLTIYRNNATINDSALVTPKHSLLNSKHVYTSNYSAYFDEGSLLRELQAQAGMRIYESIDCADVLYDKKPFVIKLGEKKKGICFFEYNNGCIYGYNSNEKTEFSYVHLQKRKMKVFCKNLMHYYIFPNVFVGKGEKEEVQKTCLMDAEQYAKNQRKLLFWRRVKNIRKGALKFRLLNFISKMYYNGK